MSKKRKNKNMEMEREAINTLETTEAQPAAKEEPVIQTNQLKEVAKPTASKEETISLEDYASLNIKSLGGFPYKREHFNAIMAFAKTHGWRTLEASASNCKELLLRYGAKLK